MGGYTQTMKVILDTNLKCTDRLDEDGVCTVVLMLTQNLDIAETSNIARKLSKTPFTFLAVFPAFCWMFSKWILEVKYESKGSRNERIPRGG